MGDFVVRLGRISVSYLVFFNWKCKDQSMLLVLWLGWKPLDETGWTGWVIIIRCVVILRHTSFVIHSLQNSSPLGLTLVVSCHDYPTPFRRITYTPRPCNISRRSPEYCTVSKLVFEDPHAAPLRLASSIRDHNRSAATSVSNTLPTPSRQFFSKSFISPATTS
jgi:hypothetical protein